VSDETALTGEELKKLIEGATLTDENDASVERQAQETEPPSGPVLLDQESIEALFAAQTQGQPEEVISPAAPPEQEDGVKIPPPQTSAPSARKGADSGPLDQQAIDALLGSQERPGPPSRGRTSTSEARASQAPIADPTRASVTMRPAQFTPLPPSGGQPQRSPEADLGILLDVPVRITVELGRSEMVVRDVLELGPGSVIELDRTAGEVLDVLVNGVAIAQGEVVVVGEQFGIRVLRILSPTGKQFLGEAGESG